MKIIGSNEIYDFNGEPLKDNKGRVLTVGYACGDALLQDYQGSTLTYDEKVMRANLADKFKDGSSAELSSSEWETVKKCVGMRWAPIVVIAVDRAIA